MSQPTDSPLILLSGSGDSHLCWLQQIAELPTDSTIAIDLPGHGDNIGAAEMPTTVAGYVATVWNALDARGITRVRVAGHSLGGAIALQMQRDDPERIVALGLIGTGARLRVQPELLAIVDRDQAAGLEQLLSVSYAGQLSDEAMRLTIAAMLPFAPGTLARDLHACDTFDVMQELAHIHCPTLVIVGEYDRLTPVKYARYLATHIADARLQIIPNAGHYVMLEQPTLITAALHDLQALG